MPVPYVPCLNKRTGRPVPAAVPFRMTADTQSSRNRRPDRFHRHLLYAIIVTVAVVVAGYRGVLPVFRSHLKEYLDITDGRFGLLFSVGAIPGPVSYTHLTLPTN